MTATLLIIASAVSRLPSIAQRFPTVLLSSESQQVVAEEGLETYYEGNPEACSLPD
jgi:hypothetical protein